MESALSTEKVFQGLRSSSKKNLSKPSNASRQPEAKLKSSSKKNLSKGRKNEILVAQYLEKRGWKKICKNKKIFGVEIDLIAKKRDTCILVEVKSLNHSFLLEKIISPKQKQRLKKVASMLSMEKDLRLLLATVSPKKEIAFYSLSDGSRSSV